MKRFNLWFDRLPEPNRFLMMMMTLTFPPIVMASNDTFPVGVRVGGITVLLGLIAMRVLHCEFGPAPTHTPRPTINDDNNDWQRNGF